MVDDTISRRAAIFVLEERLRANGYSNSALVSEFNRSIGYLRRLPSAQPEPKIGHWIDDKCSVCGKGIEDLISSREWYRNEEPNFCPFCGLKLVDSQESEE